MKWNKGLIVAVKRNLSNCVKKPEKNSGLQRGLNPWPRDTGAMLYQLSYEATDVGSRSIMGSYVPVKEMSVNNIWNESYMNWNEISFHFISAVHIWFISYIINTHFFHGNIWTHNWPAPNVSGFIAQLVEHRTGIARSRVQTPLKSWIFFFFFFFFQASLRNCLNCVSLRRSYLYFISFPQFIYDSFHISLT